MERFSRQITLKEIGEEGQEKLLNAKTVVIGLGALGSVASELLLRAGIRKLHLVDFDKIEESNLQRQSLYSEEDVGKLKVEAAKEHLMQIDKEAEIRTFNESLDDKNTSILLGADIIIDCTDNITARLLLNKFALNNSIPLVIGAASGVKGFVYNVVKMPERACYSCMFKSKMGETCRDSGILNSTSHIVASIQVSEAVKIILGKEFMKEALFIDGWKQKFAKYEVKRNKNCEFHIQQ